jgi:dGTPase
MSEELSCYAVAETHSRGRLFAEKPHPYRSDFERDRDRIIHCSAFRRLEGKTQVFTPGLDDYYRTRLTHSIEVAQIGRTIAKTLHLNVNLTGDMPGARFGTPSLRTHRRKSPQPFND